MTETQLKIDALLEVGASRLLRAADATARMREAFLTGDNPSACESCKALHDHMNTAERVFGEAAALIQIHSAAQLALQGIVVQQQKSGLIH